MLLRDYFSITLACRWALGAQIVCVANTGPSKGSVSQNLSPDWERDPLRRIGEKLSGLYLWVHLLVELFFASNGFGEDGDRKKASQLSNN